MDSNTLERMEQVGWYWPENDLRMVMDCFGFPVVVPFCDQYDPQQFVVI
jgi:hypothetical protein